MKLTLLAVNRPVAMTMVIMIILVIGTASFIGLDVDLFPHLEYPTAAIQINYPGTGPEEVEHLITRPVENALGTLANVQEIRSTSRLGGALITVEFDWGTDMERAMNEIRDRLDQIENMLPAESSAPLVLQFGPQNLPLLQLALSSSEHDITETKRIAENVVQPRLESVEGVASVQIEGGHKKEIRITLRPDELQNYGLSLNAIKQILQAENLNLPGGTVIEQNKEMPLRIRGQFASIREIEDLLIPTMTGEAIPLSTLGKIEETYQPTSVISKLNKEPSVGILIHKQAGANTVAVGNALHDALRDLEEDLPPSLSMAPIFDESLYIKQSIMALSTNIIFGAALAVSVLYVFLRNWRSTLIIAVSIPVSVVAAFGFMFLAGQSLNLLTLGGLALGVGMMVDNAIVIMENVHRYKRNGFSPRDAAVKGTREVGPALLASTLTTVIVFIPMIFVEGLAAQLFKPLALVIALSLAASLFTSIILVPLLFSKLRHAEENEQRSRFQDAFERLKRVYEHLLQSSLRSPKKIVFAALFILLISAAMIPWIGTEFMPHLDQSILYMDIHLPVGTSMETTLKATQNVEDQIADIPEIEHIYVSVGGVGQFQIGAGSLSNRANYTLPLVPADKRSRSDHEIAAEIRQKLSDLPGISVNINAGDSGEGLAGPPIVLHIQGPDVRVLKSLSEDVASILQQIDGVTEIRSHFNRAQEEIHIEVDRFMASQYGISTAQVADAILQANQGVVASRLIRAGEELNVRLTFGEAYHQQLDRLKLIDIPTEQGNHIPLQQIVQVKKEAGPYTISRSNKMREIRVQAELFNRDLGSAITDIRDRLEEELTLPSGYQIHFGGQEEERSEAFETLSAALVLALLLVYMVMAAQFESLIQPLIIMGSVPLAGIGVLLGLFLTDRPLGVGAMVGLIVLGGIVVNNAIVFVDYVNTLRKEGLSRENALIKAGSVRLRPILMTSLTTILGLAPLMFGLGEGSELQAPLATVVIFGLISSTGLTLIFMPVVYQLCVEWREKRREQT